jgi:hypothetical protein
VIADIRNTCGDIDVKEVLSGQFTVSPDVATSLPAEVLVESTEIVVHEPPPPPPPGSEEERVAQVLAASEITSEQMESAAEGFTRILERVAALRLN